MDVFKNDKEEQHNCVLKKDRLSKKHREYKEMKKGESVTKKEDSATKKEGYKDNEIKH